MAQYGFVYLLANECMPGLYKIGCTKGSPHERADNLSAATGVPAPFEVVCYVESKNHQRVEAEIHRALEHLRPRSNREFFGGPLRDLAGAVYWAGARNPDVVTFCDARLDSWLSLVEESLARPLPDIYLECLEHAE